MYLLCLLMARLKAKIDWGYGAFRADFRVWCFRMTVCGERDVLTIKKYRWVAPQSPLQWNFFWNPSSFICLSETFCSEQGQFRHCYHSTDIFRELCSSANLKPFIRRLEQFKLFQRQQGFEVGIIWLFVLSVIWIRGVILVDRHPRAS